MTNDEIRLAVSRCTREEKAMLVRLPHQERLLMLEIKLQFPGAALEEEPLHHPTSGEGNNLEALTKEEHETRHVRDIPHARSDDPSTSKKAAAEVEEEEGGTSTIRPKSLKHLALQELAMADLTSNELVRRTGKDGIWKRVSDLKNAGLIDVVGQRVDPETRKENDVMAANEYGREALLILSAGATWTSE